MVIHQGDVFWITLSEPVGSEPAYRHPHVVIQNNLFNRSRIHAAGVNPVDWKIGEGRLKEMFPHLFPLILGWDLAGTDMHKAYRNKVQHYSDEDNRDLLIYLLWQAGRLSNIVIGAYFGLTYSAISRRVKGVNDLMLSDPKMKNKYATLKSRIKDCFSSSECHLHYNITNRRKF